MTLIVETGEQLPVHLHKHCHPQQCMTMAVRKIEGSVYFTENSGYRSLKNRSCVTVFGSCSVTLTVMEPLEDVSGSANHDFRTSCGVSVMGPTSESSTSAVAAREHSRWKWMEGPIGSCTLL